MNLEPGGQFGQFACSVAALTSLLVSLDASKDLSLHFDGVVHPGKGKSTLRTSSLDENITEIEQGRQ